MLLYNNEVKSNLKLFLKTFIKTTGEIFFQFKLEIKLRDLN